MNCLEFHRAKLADPHRLPPEAQTHLAECGACGAFARSVDESERGLEQALAVRVPDGLADRVLLRARGGRRPWAPWALAASVLLALALGASALLYRPGESGVLALQAIQHVAAEPESLAQVRDQQPLDEMIRATGGTLKEPLGKVRYVKLCPVEDGQGWHVVLETAEGLATLFIVPGKNLAGPQRASSGEWNALARPTPRGYYAVVTPSSRATAYVDRLLRERIDWNA